MLLNDTKCLFTNYHIIKKELINKNINIELYNNNRRINIKLNQKYIKFFEDLDITIIELNNSSFSELIKDVEFLDYDSNYIKGYNQYKNIDIFILQYLRDDIEVASGKVIGILNNFEFTHSVDTDNCASGSPIILPIILKVIGILILIVGTITNFILIDKYEYEYTIFSFIVPELRTIVSGMILIGSAEIVKLLQDIKNRMR